MRSLPYEVWFALLAIALAVGAKGWHLLRAGSHPAPPARRQSLAPDIESELVADVAPDPEATRLYSRPPPHEGKPAPKQAPTELNVDPVPFASDSRVKIAFEQEAEEEETTSPVARILLSAKGDSDRGRMRRINEDSLLFLPERSLFAVADGMGGHQGGSIASSLAVQTLRRSFERERFVGGLRSDKPIPRRAQELASGVLQANWAVFQAADADPNLSDMGTTLVAARFSPNKQRVYIANVGDSRCYRLRRGKLRQLTTDQTMRLVGLQGDGANDLLQAIGVTSNLAIDVLVDKPQSNDIYLLCSDGLSKMVNDEEITQLLLGEPDLEAAVYGLIERANDHGGKDNVTVALIKVMERAVRAAPGVDFKGWTKLPSELTHDVPGSDDVTVLGTVSCEDPTTIGKLPQQANAAQRRKP
jgi:protein phosphatase